MALEVLETDNIHSEANLLVNGTRSACAQIHHRDGC